MQRSSTQDLGFLASGFVLRVLGVLGVRVLGFRV